MAKRSSRTVKAKKAMEMHVMDKPVVQRSSMYYQIKVIEEENAFGLKGLPPLHSLDNPISLSEDSTSYVDYILQKQNPPEKKVVSLRKSKIDRMSEQLIRNKHLASIGLRKMNEGEKGSGARLPSQLKRRETEEFTPVNIVDDDELEIDKDGKIVHRWKAVLTHLTKQNSNVGAIDLNATDNKKEISIQITPARKSADSRRSFVGIRHSFVLPRTGEEGILPEQESKESSLRCLTASRSFTEAQQRSGSPSAQGSRRSSSVASEASPRDSVALKRLGSTRSAASETSSMHPDEIDGDNDWILKGISKNLSRSPEKTSRLSSARSLSRDGRDAMQCEPSEHGVSEALPESEAQSPESPDLVSNNSGPSNVSTTDQQQTTQEQEATIPRPARIYEPLTMDELLASEPQLKITQTERAFISKWRHGLHL
jgi:hypothetical protein